MYRYQIANIDVITRWTIYIIFLPFYSTRLSTEMSMRLNLMLVIILVMGTCGYEYVEGCDSGVVDHFVMSILVIQQRSDY